VQTAACQLKAGDALAYHWIFLQRMEITIDLAQVAAATPMQIIMPVSTMLNQRKVNARFGALDINGQLIYISNQFSFDMSAAPVAADI
jgi:hypothetical protein